MPSGWMDEINAWMDANMNVVSAWEREHPTLMDTWSRGARLTFEGWHDGIARWSITARSHEIVRKGLTEPNVPAWQGRITLSEPQNLRAYCRTAEEEYRAMIARQYGVPDGL
jgi:hypothetical protein